MSKKGNEIDLLGQVTSLNPVKNLFDAFETYQREETEREKARRMADVYIKNIDRAADSYDKKVNKVFETRKYGIDNVVRLAGNDIESRIVAMDKIVEIVTKSPEEQIGSYPQNSIDQYRG